MGGFLFNKTKTPVIKYCISGVNMQLNNDVKNNIESGLSLDKKTAELINAVFRGRGGELNTVVQSVYRSLFFGKSGDTITAEIFIEIALSETEHFYLLNSLMQCAYNSCRALSTPVGVNFYKENISSNMTIEKILLDAIADEMLSISAYNDAINKICDKKVLEVIEKIKESEQHHLALLQNRLKEIKNKKRKNQ